MKEFRNLLTENGVVVPSPKRNIINKIIYNLRESKFRKEWGELLLEYKKLQEQRIRLETDRCYYEHLSEELKKQWGIDMPPLPEEELKAFTTKDELEALISQKAKELEAFSRPREIYDSLVYAERRKWLTQLFVGAPEGASRVVIKDNSYTPYPENLEAFEKTLQEGGTPVISIMGMCPVWVTFRLDREISDEEIRRLGVNRACTTEYL